MKKEYKIWIDFGSKFQQDCYDELLLKILEEFGYNFESKHRNNNFVVREV